MAKLNFRDYYSMLPGALAADPVKVPVRKHTIFPNLRTSLKLEFSEKLTKPNAV
jgi:hypothetical protein